MPRVTVICPTYNRSNILPYSIGSILDQTYSDWELLVVGDACTDDSAAVVEEIARTDQRVRWINLAVGVRNQFGPNNEGLAQARGELIAYAGHDDLWLKHHLQILVDAIDAGADVAYSLIRTPSEPDTYLPLMFRDNCNSPCAVMHRRELTERLGNWRDYREITDYPQVELWRRLRENNAKFQFVPRLSVIKPMASFRDNVYKTRSSHEQQYWARRIKDEPELETTLLVALVQEMHARQQSSRLFGLVERFRYHWHRLKRGQLPHFSLTSNRQQQPGEKIRTCNRVRGVDNL